MFTPGDRLVGHAAALTPGEPGSRAAAGFDSSATTGGALFSLTYFAGTANVLHPADHLYAAIGAGNLPAYVQGTDDQGGAAISNLGR